MILLKNTIFHICKYLIIGTLFIKCSPKSHKEQQITGAWMFKDLSGMYNEALISNDFFIIHNEEMGTSISKILDLSDAFFTISTEDNGHIKYQISNSETNNLVILNEFEKLELKPIDISTDIDLIGHGNQEEIAKYWQEFRERKNSIEREEILL